MLTGFASITTGGEAIKLGASHYLAKPATASEIEATFRRTEGDTEVPLTMRRASLRTSEWELTHETLRETGFNISEAAHWHASQGAGPQAGQAAGEIAFQRRGGDNHHPPYEKPSARFSRRPDHATDRGTPGCWVARWPDLPL